MRLRDMPRTLLPFLALLLWAASASGWGFEEVIPAQLKSIERGTKWLLSAQNKDGSWGMDIRDSANIACTATAGMALLAAGNTEKNGPSAECVAAVRKAVDYLLKRMQRVKRGTGIDDGEQSEFHTYVGARSQSMYAVIFLSQIYGMQSLQLDETRNEQVRRAVELLSDTLAKCQESDGSWYKDTYSSLQATALGWMALRSSASTGVAIHGAAVDRTLKFIRKQYNPSNNLYDGGNGERGNPIYASASAIRVLYGMGEGQTREVHDAVTKLVKGIAGGEWQQGFLTNVGEDYPAALMLTHALIHENGENWQKWFTFVRGRLTKTQNADGSWTATSCLRGRTFVTACALLCLETPLRLLPLEDL